MKDRFYILFTILFKYGWLLFIFFASSFTYTFKDGSEDMFTRGVIALCSFLILTAIETKE